MSLKHDHKYYANFLGELLLCFTVTHEGSTHECILVDYLWPHLKYLKLPIVEEPLLTRYEFATAQIADRYQVWPVEQASHHLITILYICRDISHSICSHLKASHRISPHRIAPHCITSHRNASHLLVSQGLHGTAMPPQVLFCTPHICKVCSAGALSRATRQAASIP